MHPPVDGERVELKPTSDTFLGDAAAPADINHGERAIRTADVIRKNTSRNRSLHGAEAQAVLMSIHRTLKQRGHDPLATIIDAVRQFLIAKNSPAFRRRSFRRIHGYGIKPAAAAFSPRGGWW